jgi:Haemolysin-III related
MGAWECVVTLFTTYHNETWNVFTHLVPGLVHAWLLVSTPWEQLDPVAVIAAFFVLCVSVCFFLSARYHLFMPTGVSASAYRALLNADVVGVNTCFLGATTCMLWLPLACTSPALKTAFLLGVYVVSTALVVLAHDVRQRGAGFLVMVLGMVVALAARFQSVFAGEDSALIWVTGIVLLVLGGAINVARVPERFAAAGALDYALNSHFIMHVLTAVASFICLYGALRDVTVARAHPTVHACAVDAFPVAQWLTARSRLGDAQRAIAALFGAEDMFRP